MTEYTGSRYNRLTVIELEADREALDAAIEAARGDRTKPVTLPLLDRTKLIEALEWALNEISGKTRYETDEQFENALSHTVAVLEKAKREAAMDTLLAIDGELL
jgi:hypothetical protein